MILSTRIGSERIRLTKRVVSLCRMRPRGLVGQGELAIHPRNDCLGLLRLPKCSPRIFRESCLSARTLGSVPASIDLRPKPPCHYHPDRREIQGRAASRFTSTLPRLSYSEKIADKPQPRGAVRRLSDHVPGRLPSRSNPPRPRGRSQGQCALATLPAWASAERLRSPQSPASTARSASSSWALR